MTNEQSIKIIRELLVEIDNGGVLCSEKEREELGTCSCCGERVIVGNFCPNCGADMTIRCPKCGNELADVTDEPKRAKWAKDYICWHCFDAREKIVSYSKGEVE